MDLILTLVLCLGANSPEPQGHHNWWEFHRHHRIHRHHKKPPNGRNRPVPGPAVISLIGIGAIGLISSRRKRRKTKDN